MRILVMDPMPDGRIYTDNIDTYEDTPEDKVGETLLEIAREYVATVYPDREIYTSGYFPGDRIALLDIGGGATLFRKPKDIAFIIVG